jgi:aminoglycoside phosphotransferase (APT) family kinase protein
VCRISGSSRPDGYERLLALDLPLEAAEIDRLRAFAPAFGAMCEELAAVGVPETVQHDDLHHHNVFVRDGAPRVIDWGDASIAHPFATLVVTFRFLQEAFGLRDGDRALARLRDAYLEPWGDGLAPVLPLAMRVGAFARAVAEGRTRAALPYEERMPFDEDFAVVLRRALAGVSS